MKNSYDVIIRPIITEKSMKSVEGSLGRSEVHAERQKKRGLEPKPPKKKYTFEVKQGVNKVEVKKAVEEIFNVKVEAVNMMNTMRKRRKVGKYEGLRPAVQKAIVTVENGYKIDQFEI